MINGSSSTFSNLNCGLNFEALKALLSENSSKSHETFWIAQNAKNSQTIKRQNVVVSKDGYKIFPELYEYLLTKIHDWEIRNFLRLEFPSLYNDYYEKRRIKYLNNKIKTRIKNNQPKLI
jgi:hypothetical protein